MYISQDPIGLKGNNPNFYGYTKNANAIIDPIGLNNFLFRGNSNYTGGDIGSALGTEADISTPWEHVRMGDNPSGKTTAFTSFTTDTKVAKFFGDGKMSNVVKISLDDLKKLEAEGKIKIHTPEAVAQMMKDSGNKKLRIDANNIKKIMEKNSEVLIEGIIDAGLVQGCR